MAQFHEQFRTIQSYWTNPQWLAGRMLFLSGSRQVGKTTLVTSTLCHSKDSYFNWDDRRVRMDYQKNPDFFVGTDSKWICFDEIHKRPRWKDILKGVYDVYKNRYHFVITGSARLDLFKKSGDSLVGRYFHTQLFPLQLPDFHQTDFQLPESPHTLIEKAADLKDSPSLEDLLSRSGFPEPFFSGNETFWKRWSLNHRDLILTEDLRDLSKIVEVDKVGLLLEMIQPSIGSTLSYLKLGKDLETSHTTIKRWLEMLAKVELAFSVSPYSKKIRRSFKQERKWFYTDWRAASVGRFENFVASALHRAVSLYTDRFGEKMSLHYVRTHDGAEVDFLVCKNKTPWLLVEAKEGGTEISSGVYRFARELKVPCAVVTLKKNFYKKIQGREGQTIYCISWAKLGQLLP